MKRIFSFFLLFAALAVPALGETILWEDESGKVLRQENGDIDFIPADKEGEPEAPSFPEGPGVTLQYGDSGSFVLEAQNRLTELGYYHGKCSGDFLEGTQSAVRRFQRFNDLRESEKLTPETWDRLFSAAAIARDGTTPDATPSPMPKPTPFTFRKTVKYGDSGEIVSAVQTRLSELGFYTAKVSGGFYKVTRQALRDFQTHNGLHADGIAGQETQELLFSENALPISAVPRPTPTPIPAQYTLMVDTANQIVRAYTYDETGAYTVLVREMICSTGTKRNPTPLGTTVMPRKRARWGYFPTWGSHAQYLTRIDSLNAFHSVLYAEPDETTLSVDSFRALGTAASHGCVRLLVSDAKWIYDNCKEGTIVTVYEGEYDPEYTMTLKPSLNSSTLRERPLPEPTPTPVYAPENWPSSYRVLSRGKKGEDVFMVQMRLAELGYYHGTVTGGYYGGTIKAVEDFQRDHGLTVDGAAGKETQKRLFSPDLNPTPAPALAPAPAAPITPTPLPVSVPALSAPPADSVG